ncbi:MAG: hypothetical protein RIM99_13505 [Cyclobacteriaceae bacterium]
MNKIKILVILLSCSQMSWSQNSFPLLSSGQYTGGGGDHTTIGSPQLKLVGTTTYPRIVHLSVTSGVSAVYNFETGKNAYWGEPSDIGQYFFRGRNLIVEQGSLGIGITNPEFKLSLPGLNENISIGNNTFINGEGSTGRITNNAYRKNGWKIYDSAAKASTIELRDNGVIDMYGTVTNGLTDWKLMFGLDAPSNKVYFPNGNVGIGTTNPQSKLAVEGQIRATEVKVLADISVPDYVFEADYELRTLKETKEFVTENKHLPEIPSAAEIGENGIDLGDMNMRLLKKIEELTLYQIDLMEKLEEQQKRIEKLENK